MEVMMNCEVADRPTSVWTGGQATNPEESFWLAADRLVASSQIVLDRPRGSPHPRYPEWVYPLDYGYLDQTRSNDGGGVDVWRGSLSDARVTGAVVTIDLVKRDAEIKLLVGCTSEETTVILAWHNGMAEGVTGGAAASLLERATP